ncbi:PaaX family transcriptional regulator C-terminal domain-containing protein [Leucobacter sp. UT-8R-CII-1-4]|uniref:PaaX family transcriptional regulator n=1 Tax=Leucobacter sp. UT-8R-CII-1-4 TaxID=3040075 RepID=UPI0024A9353E|nr:PaaX family transcriptional regulator C-terminal domain-containing protein [Leucobacter sp. UT-8R-CII-1-4]MDI6023487.1 PaaX family transcriptional regulator C-terminal domain-containing protein [Leucobacter sp. UT-8R-CII-1-4]
MASGGSHTLLVTLLGGFARRTDDWLPISGIVTLLGALDIDDSSVRTAVSRLKKRSWLEAERRNTRIGYTLTDEARAALEAGDRVIWHSRQPALLEDGWCITSFSLPEAQRAKRHLLRSRLMALGFGNVGSGTWIAPARMTVEASELVETLGLSENTAIFVGTHEGGQDIAKMVRESWDLDEIHERYREFVATHQHDFDSLIAEHGAQVSPRIAFVQYMRVLDDWRVLPMRDPGLPRELLREDWAGDDAVQLLERVVETLEAPALEYVRSVVDAPR